MQLPAFNRFACLPVVLFLLSMGCGSAQQSDISERFLYVEREAMNTATLPEMIAIPLDRYYIQAFGGQTNWAAVQSIRFDGILHLPQGKIRFIAFKKKPNLCKIVIFGEGSARMIMAYDGKDAWQLLNAESDDPVDMPELEALNFIRDAEIGGNLMYPNFPGKRIERLPDRGLDGVDCVILQVTRPDGQQVEYALDSKHLTERRMVVTNAQTGLREVTTHSDFQQVAGLQVPFRSVMHSEGKWVHEVQMLRAQVNTGVVSWMFQRSAATYIPPTRPLQVARKPSGAVDLDFPGDSGAADFVLPDLSEEDRLELLRDLD